MGNFYEGISEFFLPYPAEPRPFLLTLNAGEKEGVLALEPYDFDYKGGPRLPDRYRPYVAGSPYLRCHCRTRPGPGASARRRAPERACFFRHYLSRPSAPLTADA